MDRFNKTVPSYFSSEPTHEELVRYAKARGYEDRSVEFVIEQYKLEKSYSD